MSANVLWVCGGIVLLYVTVVVVGRYASERVDRLLAEDFGPVDLYRFDLPSGPSVRVQGPAERLRERVDYELAAAYCAWFEETAREIAALPECPEPKREWA